MVVGIIEMRMAFLVRQQSQYPVQRSIWSRVGSYLKLRDAVIYLVMMAAVGAAVYAALSVTAELYSAGNYVVSKGLHIYLGGFVAYAAARPRLKGVAGKVFGWLSNKGPNYSLTTDGAEAFLRYEIGPDVPQFVKSEKEIYRFFKGEIPRPNRLFIRASDAVGTTVLMRGPSLLYLIGFSRPNCQDLVDACHSYRRGRGLPIN